MRFCIFCGSQVADGVRGRSDLGPALNQAFGRRGNRMIRPVAESAMPDENEHMAFQHGFIPAFTRAVDGKIVEQGPWVSISDDFGHTFGETWERIDSKRGRCIDNGAQPLS